MRKFPIQITLRVLLGSLAITQATLAATLYDLTGIWAVESTTPQGMIPQTVEFTQTKYGISGLWRSWYNGASHNMPLKDIELHGNSLSFKLNYAPTVQMLCKGTFRVDGPFTMTWIADAEDGMPVRTRTFRRLSSKEFAELKASAPKNLITKKLPLSPLRDLPPNGLALKPPMGWNSWNPFKETIDDKTVREIADALVSTGLRDAGYTYVNIDDGWQGLRDGRGVLQPNSKFPDMKALADYVHARGLGFGIYTVAGPISCVDYVGSHGHVEQDAQTFAKWGADYLKYDWCSANDIYSFKSEGRAIYQKMAEALRATGRPIVYSICSEPPTWGRKAGGNLWRTGDDSVDGDRWKSISARFEADGSPDDSGPGGWNDPDMLLVGLDGLTNEEGRTNMTLWAMLAAPLLLGNDIRHMTDEVKEILINKEVIAVDQDALGKQGHRVVKNVGTEIWTKPLVDGSIVIAFFNREPKDVEISAKWSNLGLKSIQKLRDLWRHVDLGERESGYAARVPAHGSILLRARGTTRP